MKNKTSILKLILGLTVLFSVILIKSEFDFTRNQSNSLIENQEKTFYLHPNIAAAGIPDHTIIITQEAPKKKDL